MGEITEALIRKRQEREQRPRSHDPRQSPPRSAESRTPSGPGEPLDPRDGPEEPEPREAPQVHILETRTAPWAARAVLVDPGTLAEHFRNFALRVRRELESRRARTVLITSAVEKEGKTTVACNLALALGSMAGNRRIALVDLDLGNPSVGRALNVTPRTSFERVLSGAAPLRDAELRTQIPALDLFLVDRPSPRAHEVLSSPNLGTALRQLSKRYDTVVLDAPPVLPVPDVPLILAHAETCLTVVQSGTTRRAAFCNMLETLPREKLVGVFFNRARAPRDARRYERYASGAADPEVE